MSPNAAGQSESSRRQTLANGLLAALPRREVKRAKRNHAHDAGTESIEREAAQVRPADGRTDQSAAQNENRAAADDLAPRLRTDRLAIDRDRGHEPTFGERRCVAEKRRSTTVGRLRTEVKRSHTAGRRFSPQPRCEWASSFEHNASHATKSANSKRPDGGIRKRAT